MTTAPRWPMSPSELEAAARERLTIMAYDYIAGGAEDERTLKDNREAFQRHRLRPHVLTGNSEPQTTRRLLGSDLALPVLLAPVSVQQLAHPRGELAAAAAARRAGTIFCLSTLSSVSIEDVAAVAGSWWFQLYVQRDRGLTRELVYRATAAGCSALILTADLPVLGRRERDERNRFHLPGGVEYVNLRGTAIEAGGARSQLERYAAGSLASRLTWDDLEQLVVASPVPLLVKGLLRGDDAARALGCGVAAIIVSNHGGRQLDGSVAALDALPEVVEAAAGAVPVLLDGGVRRGTDVLVALCLGATATLIGRPFIWALAVDGEEGVVRLLGQLHDEIRTALSLIGAASLDQLGPQLVT